MRRIEDEPFLDWVRYWLKCLLTEHRKSTEYRDVDRNEPLYNNEGQVECRCARCGLWWRPHD